METSSNWFEDPALLTAEVKRAKAVRSPGLHIRGYDNPVELARGGQGIVYRAVQRSTHRQVAVKVLLDGGLASGVAQRRFEREIDMVASLRHPNIVSVYDSGTTDDGRLYLVMEFVEGVPLDKFWPSTPPMREALSVLATVAEAVQYAHQRGVIHRDLKPSNIRVDSAGQPHILDFGLAKAASREDGDREATLSTTGQFMGSLPWASPEQAVGDPDSIDARTDVYSLGVVLHQVLTGRFPYDVTGGLKAALDNIIHAEPTRADRIRPEVGDEVSTIVAKALAKDPERRYQSAGDLARDIRRYLAGEPIEAKRDSAWYTLRKTMRRYRIVVGAASAVLIASLVALLVTLSALGEARLQRDRAEAQSARALAEAARAKAVSRFVETMLAAADPGKEGKDIRVVDVLGPASRLAEQTLRDQPHARSAVHGVLSSAYRNLQMYEEAVREARIAIEIAEREFGGKGVETSLARTALAAALTDMGRPDEGLREATQAHALAEEAEGPDCRAALEAQMAMGSALDDLQRTDEALALKRQIAERAAKVLGPEAQETLGAEGNLGRTYYVLGRLDEAIELLESVVDRSGRVLGPDNIATLAPISTLVSAYNAKGHYDKSEPLLKDAWERLKRTYGPESHTALVYANNYAVLLNNTGRSAEALPIAEEALAGLTDLHGPDHVTVLRLTTLIGSIHGRLGDQAKQLEWQQRALEAADRTLGRTHQTTVYIRNNYASTLGALGRYDEAVAEFRRCAEDAELAFSADHSMPPAVRYNLCKNLVLAGREAEALDILPRAAEQLLKSLGPESDWTRGAIDDLAELLDKYGRPEDAASWRSRLKTGDTPR
jgi:tetratricopeptide (TPR) repeat protein